MKLIIEIPEEQYNDIVKYLTDNDGNYAYSDFNLREIIRNGTPDKMLKLIDNAPTVEEVSVIEFKEPLPLVKAQKIVKTLSKRPQGEWIPKRLWDNTHIWVCSECGNQNKHGITVEKACWKCGADMKGGAE